MPVGRVKHLCNEVLPGRLLLRLAADVAGVNVVSARIQSLALQLHTVCIAG